MKRLIVFLKKPQGLLALALVLVILGSFFAGLVNTSGYSVQVKKVEFQADHGTLDGLLYLPKGAGAEDPRPVIITTHGYLNSKEMQDAPAVEMSRRGYIVLALDMYDHGDSHWGAPIPAGQQFSTFWVYSQFDAAKYIYNQPYTKKDSKGNAYIAVSGHSMGGFSTLAALYMDEMNSLKTGYRMIYTGISVGADYSYTSAIAPEDQFLAAFGSRTVGMVAGHYDEFFFNKSDAEKTPAEKAVAGTVTYKNFPATASGEEFLGLPANSGAGEAGKFYTVDSGELKDKSTSLRPSQTGERVVYTPNETHPWNTFSLSTTADLIDFYNHAFSGVISPSQTSASIPSGNQVWWLKEMFTLIALIGFFLMFVPLTTLLLRLPFLKKAATGELPAVSVAEKGSRNLIYWVSIVVSALIPAILFPTLMDKQPIGLNILTILASIVLGLGIVVAIAGFILRSRTPEDQRKAARYRCVAVGGAVTAVVSLVLILAFANAAGILPLGHLFNEPTTNQIAYWAVVSGLIAALITIGFYYFDKKISGTKFESYGIAFHVKPIVSSLCVAVLDVFAGYLLLFVIQAVFGTDFRFWTLAVRTFNAEQLVTALRYMPFFLVYYFINTMALNANTKGRRGGYATAILLNIGGLVLWLICQYGKDFLTGVSLYPAQALNGILLFALVPCLGIAAVFARKTFEKTNNVWLGAFLNTLLFTVITAANTVMFWNLV